MPDDRSSEPGTTDPHRCEVRVVLTPIGVPVTIETAEGLTLRGYIVPDGYQLAISEVVHVGRKKSDRAAASVTDV